MSDNSKTLSAEIYNSEKTKEPIETVLKTDQRVLSRITDGIYRQPASALRELISNAYDADATEVIIYTDAPRFGQISVRDNGRGLTPEMLEHLIKHIGGSAKRDIDGKTLGITSKGDENLSPGGRKLIGKLGIGLFSVAQFTRHFLIITKTKDDKFRTIADITLGPVAGPGVKKIDNRSGHQEIETGHARIWRERAGENDSQGTEIKLLELLPRTKAELASDDLWSKIELQKDYPDEVNIEPPRFHVGRMMPKQTEVLDKPPQLPWNETDSPRERFFKFVYAVKNTVETVSDSVDLDILCDHYLQTLWNLALSSPLEYIETHPFDLPMGKDMQFYELENRPKGQSKRLHFKMGETPRKELKLKASNGATKASFEVYIDGVQLLRPILFKNLPKTSNAVQTPLLFIGRDVQKFEKKPVELSGGPLSFEAYLFWAPKIIPKQHQGVILRVGNAAGALFDKTFMSYQVSEQTRTRQITAEIYVHEGLDGALNLDRESFNYAHPHYQYLLKWLHSALRQLANKHKELGKVARSAKVTEQGERTRAEVEKKVVRSLKDKGIDDIPDVIIFDEGTTDVRELRNNGSIALRRKIVLPQSSAKNHTGPEVERRKILEMKAIAIAQILNGWGLLDDLSYSDQEKLIRDILEIAIPE